MKNAARSKVQLWGWIAATVVSAPLVACAQRAQPAASTGAIVALRTPSGERAGQAVLTAVPDGVEIVLTVERLTPGLHGWHIHAEGVCAPGPDGTGKTVDFGAAGGHFDPQGAGRHGHPDDAVRHAGDAPNLRVGADGKARLRFVNPHVTLQPGTTSVLGRALVVHAEPDDYRTDPAGNSGARVLCGVVEPARMDAVRG